MPNVKMLSNSDKTAECTLISSAAVRLPSWSSSVVFKNSLQQSLPIFVTKLKETDNAMLRPTENAFDWNLARWMFDISDLKSQQSQHHNMV